MRRVFGFLACLLALQTAVYAEGQWIINSQWLFLQPSFDDTYFVSDGINLVGTPSGKRYNNDFGFRPAARVKVAYGNPECDFYFAVFYTWLYARKNRTIQGTHLWQQDFYGDNITNFKGFATARNQIVYQSVDALFLKSLWNPNCFKFNLVFGAEYAFARLLQVSDYVGPTSFVKFSRRNRFFGIGPEFGFDFEYRLAQVDWFCPGQINFNFLSLGSILASKTVASQNTHSNNGIRPFPPEGIFDQDSWRIVAALHSRCSLSYDLVFSCIRASIEIGYELNTYLNALYKPVEDNTSESVSNSYRNFNAQGPFGGLNLVF